MTVADIGAGTGYFEPYLSRPVGPSGHVLAGDIEPDMVRYLRERAAREHLDNVGPVLADASDPKLPARGVDRILIVASLAAEGFIHFSTERQLLRSAERFFAGRDDVVVVSVREDRLAAPLRFEVAHGEPFPHLYGALNLDAVVDAVPLPLVNGRHEVPEAWAERRHLFVGSRDGRREPWI
jgi:uncharacterized protein (DUF952 family)